jgi:hypothetical protein
MNPPNVTLVTKPSSQSTNRTIAIITNMELVLSVDNMCDAICMDYLMAGHGSKPLGLGISPVISSQVDALSCGVFNVSADCANITSEAPDGTTA